jgi:hypothetical protein
MAEVCCAWIISKLQNGSRWRKRRGKQRNRMGLCQSTPEYVLTALRGGSCDVHYCRRVPKDGIRCSYHLENGLKKGQMYSRVYRYKNGGIFIRTEEEE